MCAEATRSNARLVSCVYSQRGNAISFTTVPMGPMKKAVVSTLLFCSVLFGRGIGEGGNHIRECS